MRKDVIDDRYARLWELPTRLARTGVQVQCQSLSYRPSSQGHLVQTEHIDWYSHNLRPWLGAPWAVRRLRRQALDFRPDWVIGASDAPHILLARQIAGSLGVPFAVDLYDNFESFGLTRLPIIHAAYRRALREADLISCVSRPLADWLGEGMAQTGPPRGQRLVLESTINREDFADLPDRAECRRRLGLPLEMKLIGTAGALQKERGTDLLYQAWQRIHADQPQIGLALAGAIDPLCPPPASPQATFLGNLRHEQMPLFWRALDVAVIAVRDTPFGRYSFPQKAYEVAASGAAVVAADVGAMGQLFADCPQTPYPPDDLDTLTHRLQQQLAHPLPAGVQIPSWQDQADRLLAALTEIHPGQ